VVPSKQEWIRRPLGPLTIKSWLLLLAVCITLFCINLGGARVLTDHEIDVASGAKQMAAGGDWLIPRMGVHPWLEKPPLAHWIAASLIILTGEATEWVVRLPSVAAGMGLVALVAALVGRWLGERAGLAAGLIQCTSMYLVTYARLAEADILLACMVVAAMVVFVHLQGIGLPDPCRRPRPWSALFWILVGLTNLCKGPLFGAFLILTPCLAWLLLQRQASGWKRMWSPGGLLLGTLIALVWYFLAWQREPAALDLWLYHTLGRAVGTTGYSKPWWYYLEKFPGHLLPWTAVTAIGSLPSLRGAWRDRAGADRFAWLWALVPIFLLSLSRGKHHHYLIHCLPGFTLVTVRGLFVLERSIFQGGRYAVRIAKLGAFLLAPALLAGGMVAGIFLIRIRLDVWVISAVASGGILLAGIFALRAQPVRVFTVSLIAIVLILLQAHLHTMPILDDRRDDRRFLTGVHEHLPPGALVFTTGAPETSELGRPIFYVRVPLIGLWDPGDIGNYLDGARVFFVVGRRMHLSSLERYGTVTVLSRGDDPRHEDCPGERFLLLRILRG